MTRVPWRTWCGEALLGLALVASGSAAPAAAPSPKLPEPVAKTFQATFPGAVIEKLDVEKENAVTVYDFEFRDGALEKETDIAADGTMLELTVVVEPHAVPAAAMSAVRKAAKGATIRRIEHIEIGYETKAGKVVKLATPMTNYAVELAKGKRRAEIVVTPEGRVIEPARWGGEAHEKTESKTGESS